MAKIIFMNVPGHGHVNPTLAIVKELVARGHQVLYYNTEEFRPIIAHGEVEFRPYPKRELTPEVLARAAHNLPSVSALLLETSAWLTEWMLEQIEQEKPDLLMHDSIALWGMMCGRITHLPTISSITTFVLEGFKIPWSPRLLMHMIPGAIPYLPKIVAARRNLVQKFGADSLPKTLFPAVSDLNIVFTSREFQPQTPFIDERFRFVGPSINTATRGGDFPFDQLTRHPVIYISLGTIYNNATEFYRQCFEAFGNSSAQIILSAGQQTNIAALGNIPENFIVRPSVPQLEVLQHVDLFVTHGGMNSINEALYYGVPMVVIPQQLEQYFNALQVVDKGAGVLMGNPTAFGRVTAVDLRTTVNAMLLTLGRYQSAAQYIGTTFKQAGGYLRAVEEIETFAREKGVVRETITM